MSRKKFGRLLLLCSKVKIVLKVRGKEYLQMASFMKYGKLNDTDFSNFDASHNRESYVWSN